MSITPLTLKAFAFKRAVTGALVAGAVNALVIGVALRGLPEVPVFALVAEQWNHSLMGALVPRAALLSLLVTFVTVWATVKSSAAGLVQPPIATDDLWVRKTLKVGLTRSIYALLLVLAIALILRLLLPTYTTLPSAWVMVLVTLFAAVLAYVMCHTAVLRTARALGAAPSALA